MSLLGCSVFYYGLFGYTGLEWIELKKILYKLKFLSIYIDPNQSTWDKPLIGPINGLAALI
jgi:hypothetical protein